MRQKLKAKYGSHEVVCVYTHPACICLKCKKDQEFCCEVHGKNCNGTCQEFQSEGK